MSDALRSRLVMLSTAATLLGGCGGSDPDAMRSCLADEGFDVVDLELHGAEGEVDAFGTSLEAGGGPRIEVFVHVFDSDTEADAAIQNEPPEVAWARVGAAIYLTLDPSDPGATPEETRAALHASPEFQSFEGCLA